jgi:hypothetical protein
MKTKCNLHLGTSQVAYAAWLALLSPACCNGAERSLSVKERASIPKIAQLAGVQIGYSTQEDLARLWGEGKVITGGHPNSGRVWRVKGTSWVVSTDGFDYSKRGLVIDSLQLTDGAKREKDVPFAQLPKGAFGWPGGLALGMSRSEVERILKSKSLVVAVTDQGLALKARGRHVLVNSTFGTWTANLKFSTNVLTGLSISAED